MKAVQYFRNVLGDDLTRQVKNIRNKNLARAKARQKKLSGLFNRKPALD